MAKIVGKTLGMVGYGTGGLGTNNWAADMEANLRKIDAILQAGAVAIQNAPPGSPVDGQVYVVGTSPTGTWATQANAIARWNAAGNAWEFFTPAAGWWIAVGGTDYRWSGSAWVAGWAGPALPMESYSTLGLGLFGGAGKPTAYAYQILSNRGVGFQDSRGLSWRGGFVSTDEFYGPWQDASASTSMKPYIIGDGTGAVYYKHDPLDASFKHYFTGAARFSAAVNVVGAIQQNGVDAVTATREGRFTGMRLSNMGSGQIPVSSDANGQITASGLTDDGTFLGISRTIRAWNSMARSGNTWTDLQWTQDAQQRVSMFSSSGSGSGAYHEIALVPADAEAANRELGFLTYGQKVSGKSGTNPGLKLNIGGKSIGSGGSVGGYGAQFHLDYRPDNAATMATALRIGAIGGGAADAVEAAILLRANADFLANYAKIQKDADASVGLDVVGPSGTGKFRMLNSGGGSVLGINAGSLEISCSNGIGIGTAAGNASILVSTGDVSIAKTYFSGTHRVLPTPRTTSASTAIDDRLVIYTGTTNQTESLPAATGSNRVITFSHASSSGTWTLDADGTDVIAGELQATVGSIAIFSNSSVKNRTLHDFAPGLWVVI